MAEFEVSACAKEAEKHDDADDLGCDNFQFRAKLDKTLHKSYRVDEKSSKKPVDWT